MRIVSLEAFYLLYVYHWWAASPLLAANEDKKNGVVPKLIRFLPKLNKCLCHGLYQRMGILPMLHLPGGRITAGVDAEVDVYKGFYHVYDMLEPDTAEARKAADKFVDKFRDACEKYRT